MKSNAPVDRNFDELTEKFKNKVYGGLKGEIRLAVIWRDLNQVLASKLMGKPIRICLLYTSPSPRDATLSRMPSSA